MISLTPEKGPKITYSIPVDTTFLTVDALTKFRKYKHWFAVDTNTTTLGERLLSVTAAVQGQVIELDGKPSLGISALHAKAFFDRHNAPEISGWLFVILGCTQNPTFDPNAKVALIVDAHLGELPTFNKREKPLREDFFLPVTFDLVYASADKPADSIQNALLKFADRSASFILDFYKRGSADADPNLLINQDRIFRSYPIGLKDGGIAFEIDTSSPPQN